jgi:phospholipid transport system substrate-binding protein
MAFHRLKAAAAGILTGVLIAFSAAAQQQDVPLPEPAPPQIHQTQASLDAAKNVVEEFHKTLLSAMKDSNLGFEGRFKALSPAVNETFNIPFMAEITSGIYWNRASEDERKKFLAAFADMSTATYAARFRNYTGEAFDILGVQEEGRNSIVVRAEITDSDGGHTQLNYLLRNFNGLWQVVDIYFNGSISELAVRKSDYSSILKNGGMSALAAALNAKVAEMAAEAPGGKESANVR